MAALPSFFPRTSWWGDMNTSLISKLLRASVIAALVIGAASTAWAAKPIKESFAGQGTFEVGNCDGFMILNDFIFEGFSITYFDKDGNATHVKVHTKFSESIYYNSVENSFWLDGGPGEIVNDRFDVTCFDFTGDLQSSGLAFKITVPGQGVIFHEAGRLIFDNGVISFQAGPKDFREVELAALCAALTP